jgi:hypothetical protein
VNKELFLFGDTVTVVDEKSTNSLNYNVSHAVISSMKKTETPKFQRFQWTSPCFKKIPGDFIEKLRQKCWSFLGTGKKGI